MRFLPFPSRGVCRCGCFGVESIPAILALTDCVMGLASGMTIKFFSIFFMQEVRARGGGGGGRQ